jgi:hypothetical protein
MLERCNSGVVVGDNSDAEQDDDSDVSQAGDSADEAVQCDALELLIRSIYLETFLVR